MRGQGVWGVCGGGPVALQGLVDELPPRDAELPLALGGDPSICGALVPGSSADVQRFS